MNLRILRRQSVDIRLDDKNQPSESNKNSDSNNIDYVSEMYRHYEYIESRDDMVEHEKQLNEIQKAKRSLDRKHKVQHFFHSDKSKGSVNEQPA